MFCAQECSDLIGLERNVETVKEDSLLLSSAQYVSSASLRNGTDGQYKFESIDISHSANTQQMTASISQLLFATEASSTQVDHGDQVELPLKTANEGLFLSDLSATLSEEIMSLPSIL